MRLLEDWKEALNSYHDVAVVLMDLSKAFDCLPHDILLCKLECYGLSQKAVNLLFSYLSDRKQQVKIRNATSKWADISKGVPQGSILGPLIFNVFINDIFYFIQIDTLYNYADDNILSFHSPYFDNLLHVLKNASKTLIDWFRFNCMQANPDKFQAIAMGKKTHDKKPMIKIDSATVFCEDEVKLLGIDIDFNLTFDSHILSLCKNAAQQLNILKRLSKNLCLLSKLTIFLYIQIYKYFTGTSYEDDKVW